MEATQQNENKLNVDHQTKQNTIPNMRACVYGFVAHVYQSSNLSIYLSVCSCVCLFVCLSVRVSVCSCVCLFVCLFVRVSVCLSICLSVCLSVSMSVCLFVFFCMSVYLSVYMSVDAFSSGVFRNAFLGNCRVDNFRLPLLDTSYPIKMTPLPSY